MNIYELNIASSMGNKHGRGGIYPDHNRRENKMTTNELNSQRGSLAKGHLGNVG